MFAAGFPVLVEARRRGARKILLSLAPGGPASHGSQFSRFKSLGSGVEGGFMLGFGIAGVGLGVTGL